VPVYPTSYSPLLGFSRLLIEGALDYSACVVVLPLCQLSGYAMGIGPQIKSGRGPLSPLPL